MKKLLFVLAISLVAISAQAKGKAEKAKVLHNGHVIEISVNALNAHLEHGDETMVLYEGVWMTESDYQLVLEELAALEALYQQYQDATVEEEGEFDEEEGDY